LGKLFQEFRTKFSKEEFMAVLLEQREWLKQGRASSSVLPRCFEQFFYPVPVNHAFDAVKEANTPAVLSYKKSCQA
jgi:hypothetical protein